MERNDIPSINGERTKERKKRGRRTAAMGERWRQIAAIYGKPHGRER